MKRLVIIPARLDSLRMPGKLMMDLGGIPLLAHTIRGALTSSLTERVIIATDSRTIADFFRTYPVDVVITSPAHRCGTERCAEAASSFACARWVVNVQGDQPFITGGLIDRVFEMLEKAPEDDLVSVMRRMSSEDEKHSRDAVKVVVNEQGYARRFCREHPVGSSPVFYHIGVYGYGARQLAELASLPASREEMRLNLEQLRWLEHGWQIRMIETDENCLGVNNPQDMELALKNFTLLNLKSRS